MDCCPEVIAFTRIHCAHLPVEEVRNDTVLMRLTSAGDG